MTETPEITGTVTSIIPVNGAFELDEQGELDYDHVRFGDIAPPGSVRGAAENAVEEATRWRAFVDRLRGYQREAVVVDRAPFWVPIAELVAPDGVKATCRTTGSHTRYASLQLSIAGSGFGSGVRTTLSTDLSFTCEGSALELAIEVTVTATRYVSKRLSAIIRVDVDTTASHLRLRTAEQQPSPDPLVDDVVQRLDLSAANDPGCYRWLQRLEQEATWSLTLGAAFPQAGKASIGLALSGVEGNEVAFELPYGRDYLIFHRSGHSSLLPRCAITPPAR